VTWLRRVPTETRIIVLVVFLALFQAILLSVFGLSAIRGERRQAEAQLRTSAQRFLRVSVADRCRLRLWRRADEALRDTLESGVAPAAPFLAAFTVHPDGSVHDAGGLPVWQPPAVARAGDEAAQAAVAKLADDFLNARLDEAAKLAGDLDLARQYPFARDALDEPLGLLLASSAWQGGAGEGTADVSLLLKARWVVRLNRLADPRDAVPVRMLERIDEAGRGREAFAAGVAEQERRASIVARLVRERPRTDAGEDAVLEPGFFVRRVGERGGWQVLAVDEAGLFRYLDGIVEEARAEAPPGIVPELRRAGAPGLDRPGVPLEDIAGWRAEARISGAAARARAAARGERFYWWIIGFSVVGILAGALFTARVVRREMRLAKLKSGFVSNVSHALKTPLTSIRMFCDMLISGKVRDEAEQRECLEVIHNETGRLGQLIQQVLDFGRLEARRRAFTWVRGSLGPLVAREAERFRRAVGLPRERLAVEIAVNLPDAVFDADGMREVVSNLLSNAYKYSPPHDRRIRLTLGPRRGRIVLVVGDNGPGVPPRERRRIFDQFYRADDLLTRGVEGTGLGLAIVRGIVRAHGGRIVVDDAPEGGARFAVVLPVAGGRASAPAKVREPGETAGGRTG